MPRAASTPLTSSTDWVALFTAGPTADGATAGTIRVSVPSGAASSVDVRVWPTTVRDPATASTWDSVPVLAGESVEFSGFGRDDTPIITRLEAKLTSGSTPVSVRHVVLR